MNLLYVTFRKAKVVTGFLDLRRNDYSAWPLASSCS